MKKLMLLGLLGATSGGAFGRLQEEGRGCWKLLGPADKAKAGWMMWCAWGSWKAAGAVEGSGERCRSRSLTWRSSRRWRPSIAAWTRQERTVWKRGVLLLKGKTSIAGAFSEVAYLCGFEEV